MSTKTLKLKIVTPEQLIFEEDAEHVIVPTEEGEIDILPHHVNLIGAITRGDVVAKVSGEDVPFAVVGGFVKIEDNVVTILADFAEHVEELSEEKIAEAKRRSEELKKQAENEEIVDFEHFESELERSLTRVKIADKWRKKKYRKLNIK